MEREDGTRQLLQWGASILGSGILAGVAGDGAGRVFANGTKTNGGWLALIVTLGASVLAISSDPWGRSVRNRSQSRREKMTDADRR